MKRKVYNESICLSSVVSIVICFLHSFVDNFKNDRLVPLLLTFSICCYSCKNGKHSNKPEDIIYPGEFDENVFGKLPVESKKHLKSGGFVICKYELIK